MEQDIRERIKFKCKEKINKLFRRTFASIEQQSREFGATEAFFEHDNKKGFGLIRKTILDNGNEVLSYIDAVLDMLDIEPARTTLVVTEKVMKEIERDHGI